MEIINTVVVRQEDVIIPTYGIGKPEKNPIFSEKRVYQGSSGVVYPFPVIEKILDEKKAKKYCAIYIENQYLKIMILPELGGRVQMAYDKIKQRHFVYYNQVIKPALVGLTGPWISGGIEFNWPQHHRPSTFEPIDFTIEEHEDGSKTVWVSEVERMFHTKGMAGFRLYPDKAYLEIDVKLYNRTPFPQTFLWWANPAVKVNDDYQTVFPPDVHAVFDHGKRDVSEFPIAKGTYYKVDYSAGVDISRYKNIPVPTSYMAIKSNYDFMGGYEHDTKGGLLHVANHHVSPGKKQWTWGNGAFGYAWDKNLTDEDGPYIELMTGVFTDNQPDFSWIQPFEERTFKQYFMPYSELGIVKNATKEAMVNLESSTNEITIKFYTTAAYNNAIAVLTYDEKEIWTEAISVSPETPFCKTIPHAVNLQKEKFAISLSEANGKILVHYKPEIDVEKEIPQPARAAKDPGDIESIEQLFLTGLHIEQYRHATYKATDYYEEALKRDPNDVRSNNALGSWYLKKGKLSTAELFFRTAIGTLTERNHNPSDGEPYFNLGTSLFLQERYEDAYEAFYKATWNSAWQAAAFLYLARIATRNHQYEEALELINQSINRNYPSQVSRHLKVAILRKLSKGNDGLDLIEDSLALDKFSLGCLYEKYLLLKTTPNAQPILDQIKTISRGYVHTFIAYAIDYAHAGLYVEASDLLSLSIITGQATYPMVHYYLGYFATKQNNQNQALSFFRKGLKDERDYCFPNRIEDVGVLESAMRLNPQDANAPYYLGNYWYANRQYSEAINCWEKSINNNDQFPTVHRNLALAYHNKEGDFNKAIQSLETAFFLDTSDARVLMELDQLYKKLNRPHHERLELLEKHLSQTEERDDLYLERVTLYNHLGNHDQAKKLIERRKFHPWEGGEGKVVGQYLFCHIERAKTLIEESRYEEALLLLTEAEHYPDNLGEGKLYGAQENDIHYLKGYAYDGLGQPSRAAEYFTKATIGLSEPIQAIYYNDQQPDKLFYQGLAWRKLGQADKAEQIFNRLISFGHTHMNDKIRIDYFAVSLPDLLVFDLDLDLRNKNHCHYLIGLGLLGLNNRNQPEAENHFNIVLKNDINHFGAAIHKRMIQNVVVN
jgi:tetratricopeptide (TPR) repeat protein